MLAPFSSTCDVDLGLGRVTHDVLFDVMFPFTAVTFSSSDFFVVVIVHRRCRRFYTTPFQCFVSVCLFRRTVCCSVLKLEYGSLSFCHIAAD